MSIILLLKMYTSKYLVLQNINELGFTNKKERTFVTLKINDVNFNKYVYSTILSIILGTKSQCFISNIYVGIKSV